VQWDIREWVHRAMEVVTSADEAYRWLRARGFTWKRAEVREVWKEVGRKEYWSTVLETWGPERPIPHYWIMEGSPRQRTEYIYFVRFEYYDEEGQLVSRYMSYATNERLTYGDVYSRVTGTIQESVRAAGGSLVYIGPAGVFRRPG